MKVEDKEAAKKVAAVLFENLLVSVRTGFLSSLEAAWEYNRTLELCGIEFQDGKKILSAVKNKRENRIADEFARRAKIQGDY